MHPVLASAAPTSAQPAAATAAVVRQQATAGGSPMAAAGVDAGADAETLLQFNRELLAQALGLVLAHEGPDAPRFADHAGPHLRHVIEHYETMLLRPLGEPLTYDRRARDRELERCPLRARARLLGLQQRLHSWTGATLATPVRVINRIGGLGEFELATQSTLGRELVYLASHAVHHFALLSAYCQQHGFAVGRHFGKAPSTVAHELQG